MKRILALIIIASLLFTSIAFADDSIDSDISGALLGDYETGQILYSYNIDKPVEIASITKLMTYLITMDKISQGEISMEDIITIGKAPTVVGGASFKLKEGEQVKLKTLIDAILIASGNDACVAIAEHIAGSEDEFVKLMNQKAKELGLENTRYLNSSGMPGKDGQNQMTLIDIFNLSRHIIQKYPETLEITKKKIIEVEERNFKKESTNPLLKEMEKVDGLKTGYTDKAGYCLISTMEVEQIDEDTLPFRIIGIVTGTKDEEQRIIKSTSILNYGIENFYKTKVLSKENSIKTVKIGDAVNVEAEVYPKEDVFSLVKKGTNITNEIVINENLRAPLKKGESIGKMLIYFDGEVEKEVDLIVDRDIKRANFFIRIFRYIATWIGIW